MNKKPVRVKHFANIGDGISSLAGLKKFWETTGRKIIYCQQLNVPATYYPNAVHPTKDDKGNQVMVNPDMLNMLKPLFIAQEYIEDVEIFNGQLINIDLDRIRKETFVNLPLGAIQQWVFFCYPDLSADLSKAWMQVGEVDISDCTIESNNIITHSLPLPSLSDKVIVNFTERYRNGHIHYFFLKKYQDNLLFAGTEKEHKLFCETWELNIPRIIVKDFLQLAYILKKSKFLLSNQSFLWNVSTALKTPHILELCEFAANCQCFFAPDSYGFYHQYGLTYFFDLLMNKK